MLFSIRPPDCRLFGGGLCRRLTLEMSVLHDEPDRAGAINALYPDLEVALRSESCQPLHRVIVEQRAVADAQNAKLRIERRGDGRRHHQLFGVAGLVEWLAVEGQDACAEGEPVNRHPCLL